jgi:7-carboxy-7-deazaguanine synthase
MTPDLPISEIFLSIQGEGKLAGIPSAFIRVSGCNLRCAWCDTPFASHKPEFTLMTINQIVQFVVNMNCEHVVLTGGEPAIFPQCGQMCEQLKQHHKQITLETAGTVFVDFPVDLLSISPKLSNSSPLGDPWRLDHDARRTQMGVLQRLISANRDFQIKFVLQNPGDIVEIEQLLGHLTDWKKEDVLLMPEGRNRETLHERGLWIAELCKKTGYRFCPRLQVELWGDRRGV